MNAAAAAAAADDDGGSGTTVMMLVAFCYGVDYLFSDKQTERHVLNRSRCSCCC